MGSCTSTQRISDSKIITTDIDSFDRSSTNRWKAKLTVAKAREVYETDGTIPLGCSSNILELRMHLAEPVLLKSFGEYTRDMEQLNVLMCWADILEFKDIREEQTDYQMSKAFHIYHKYIKENSVVQFPDSKFMETQLSDVKLALELAQSENTGVSSHLFDLLHQAALELLYREVFVAYKQTFSYKLSMTNLREAYNTVNVDDFEYMEELGRGGFGCVVHCRKKSTGIHYAMKIQTKNGLLQTFRDDLSRVAYEKEALALCHHPFIVSMDYAFQTSNLVLMVMDLGTAGTLLDSLSACDNHRMPEDRVRFYAAEIVLTLAHIHRMGMIYRDLKPANILLCADGHIKLVDLGGVVDVGGKAFGYNADCNNVDNAIFAVSTPRNVADISASLKHEAQQAAIAKLDSKSKTARVMATKVENAVTKSSLPVRSGGGQENGCCRSPASGKDSDMTCEHIGSAVTVTNNTTTTINATAVTVTNNTTTTINATAVTVTNNTTTTINATATSVDSSNTPSQKESSISVYKAAQPPTMKKAKSVMGTGGFMAPEMLALLLVGKEAVPKGYTAMVDYWSLAVTMFKLLTGKLPFNNMQSTSFVEYISSNPDDRAKFMSNYLQEYSVFLQTLLEAANIALDTADFITRLLHIDYRMRLGYGTDGAREIKCHEYFNTIHWHKLAQKHIVPPYIPSLADNCVMGSDKAAESVVEPIYESFVDMIMAVRKRDWVFANPTAAEQEYFASWNYVSPSILKTELGIEAEMSNLDERFKVRLFRLPLLGNIISIVTDKFSRASSFITRSPGVDPNSASVMTDELLTTIQMQCHARASRESSGSPGSKSSGRLVTK